MTDDARRAGSNFTVKSKYTISETRRLLVDFRAWVEEASASAGSTISAQRLCDIMDDRFMEFSDWLSVKDPLFKTVSTDRLDPHTVRRLLKCDLGLNIMSFHTGSIRVIDAFLQMVRRDPPQYIFA